MERDQRGPDLGLRRCGAERRAELHHLRDRRGRRRRRVHGSLDGRLWVSPDAQTSDTPTWVKADKDKDLPDRPVSQIAVDRSNYRIAYASFDGFNDATKDHPGHVFRTRDGGKKWTDISGNLPDSPVNSIILDPSSRTPSTSAPTSARS